MAERLDRNEIWKPVVGYEGRYEVSNYGRVKSLSRKVRSNSGYTTLPERILKGYVNHDGYVRYELRDGKHGVKRFGHVLVMQAFTFTQEGREIDHINLNKSDNRLENLEWVTHYDNMKHAYENKPNWHKGRKSKPVIVVDTGQRFPSATNAADFFDVTIGTVSGACKGEYKLKGHRLVYERV